MAEIVGFTPDSPSIVGFTPDETPQFASGLQKRMAEYQGMSPEQAAQKARTGLGETLVGAGKEIASLVTSPTKLAETEKSLIGAGFQAAAHPIQTAQRVGRYYYENPDIAATDVAAMATPLGPEKTAAKAVPEIATEAAEGVTPLTRAPGHQMVKRGNIIMNIAKTDPGEYTREGLAGHLEGLQKELDRFEYNPRDHPLAAKALGRVQSFIQGDEFVPVSGKTHDIRDLHTLMQSKEVKAAKASRNPKEQKYGVMIGKMLDDYASGLGDAGPQLLQGKQLHSIGRQKMVIEGALRKAVSRSRRHYTGAGLPHAIAMEFEKLKKPKIISQFNPDVRTGIEKLAEGGSQAQRAASFIGKGTIRSPMGAALDFILGGALGIPAPVIGTIGEAGRQTARHIAKKEVSRLLDITEVGSEENLAKAKLLEDKLGPASGQLAAHPETRQAMINWTKAKGKSARTASRLLAIAIARQAKDSKLVPRIQQELENMDQDNNGRATSVTPVINPTR